MPLLMLKQQSVCKCGRVQSFHSWEVAKHVHLWQKIGCCPGGDAFLSQCLWEQGFAHTTPDPIWHPQKLQMFDPSPAGLNPDDFIIWKASHILGNMLQKAAGVCEGLCKVA